MANVILGKVALTPVGEWDITNNYEKLDVVTHEGSSYISTTSILSNTPMNNEDWQLLARIGPTGPTGPQGPIGHTIEWGEIVGNIENQQDLTTALDVRLNETVREQQQLITNIEPDMKASTNYTAGELVIVDNKLLRVTSTITTGSSFTIGTNVEQVNLETVINEKASQTSVSTALATKAPLASPALTGAPTAPTPTSGDNSTKIATTAFVQDVAENKQDIPIHSISGAITSFSDGADNLPVSALTVGIDPVQDLHGYDHPWPAGGGKNLVEATGEWNVGGDGKVTAESGYTAIIAKIVQGETYTTSKNGVATIPQCMGYYTSYPTVGSTSYDGNRIIPDNATFTAPIDGYILARMATSAQTGYQIEKGSSASSYAPYSNVCPISGFSEAKVTRTGKNLLNITNATVGSLSWSVDSDGYVTSSNTTTDGRSWTYANCQWFVYLKAGTYKIIGEAKTVSTVTSSMLSLRESDDKEIRGALNLHDNSQVSGSFTLIKDQSIGILAKIFDGAWRFAIRLSSDTSDAYEPYQGTSVTIDLGETRYGGTVDVLTGEMTITKIKLIPNVVALQSINSYGIANLRFENLENAKTNAGISNVLQLQTSGIASTETEGFAITTSNNGYLRLKSTTASTPEQANAWVSTNGFYVVYELAQPLTVQLTPSQLSTLLGTNNIWADTGDILNLEYWNRDAQDLGNAIERRIQASQRATRSIIAGIETEMVASKNYASGDLLIVGDDLLKATETITSTSTLIIGTNVAKTTVAEQLIALAS